MIYGYFNKLELTQCYPSNNVPLAHLHSDMFPGKSERAGVPAALPGMPGEDGGQRLGICQLLGEKQGAGEARLIRPTALDRHQGSGSQDNYSHWTAEETEAYGDVARGPRSHR